MRLAEDQHLPTDGLNELLEEMQNSGEVDSPGVFTISDSKAREKLAEYQLPNPRFYVLNLLASAVAGGASYFRAGFGKDEFRFEFNGSYFEKADFEEIFSHILRPTDVSLQELAVALNAARTLSEDIRVESWNGQECQVLELTPNGLSVSSTTPDSPSESQTTNRVFVRESFQINRVIQRWWGSLTEKAVLKDVGGLAPLDLVLDGKALEEVFAVNPVSSFSWGQHNLESPPIPIEEPDYQWNQHGQLSQPEESYGGLSSVVCLANLDYAKEKGLTIVSNGVTYTRPSSLVDVPFACGLIAGSFPKNLSHTDLADAPPLREAILQFSYQCEVQLIRRLESEKPLPPACRERLFQWAPVFIERLKKREWKNEVAIVEAWVTEVMFLRDLMNDKHWRETLRELRGMKPGAMRQGSHLRIRRSLVQSAHQELESGRYDQSVHRLQRLKELEDLGLGGHQESDLGCWQIVRALAGQDDSVDSSIDDEVRALLYRLQGDAAKSLECECASKDKGEAYLALSKFEKAEECLRAYLENQPEPQALESLADCLTFGPESSKASKVEAITLIEQAVTQRMKKGMVRGRLTTEQIARLSRSCRPIPVWLTNVTLTVLTAWECPEFEKHLTSPFELIRTRRTEDSALLVLFNSALLSIERSLPLMHPHQGLARSRVVHALRSIDQWRHADSILARGSLLEIAYQRINRLADRQDHP